MVIDSLQKNKGGESAPSALVTPDGNKLYLRNAFDGASVFLLCSGPSLQDHDLRKLSQRGIATCAVNNAGAVFRPNLWVCYDEPASFCDVIFRDPAIMKFVPVEHLKDSIRVRDKEGKLVTSSEKVADFPSVFGYLSNASFAAERWLEEETFNCGCDEESSDAEGIVGSRTVMLVALRLLFYLGFKRIFLLGCDFRMTFGKSNYAFEQEQTRATVRGNNRTYRVLAARFDALKPHLERAGLSIYNCYDTSDLKVFPYISFDDAIALATKTIPQAIDTNGMYDRGWRKES